MNEFKANVYDVKGVTVVKTLKSTEADLSFGAVRKLMKLIKIDNIDNTLDMLKAVKEAREEIDDLLGNIFPEATVRDRNNIKVEELLSVFVQIVKYALEKALSIPTEKGMSEGDGKTVPFSQLLFQINYALCKEYTALTPFEVDEKPYSKVIELFSETREYQIANAKENKSNEAQTRKIRRPAGDDWF